MYFIARFLAALGRLFSSSLGKWIAGAMAYLGLSFATSHVVSYALNEWVADGWGQVPTEIAAWISYMNVDAAFSVILSGYTAGFAARGALGGILKLQGRVAASSIPGAH